MRNHIDYFNRAALTYDQQSTAQQKIGRALLSCLKPLPQQARIIDLGCGTGLTTAELAKQQPYQEFIALDLADQLLIHAAKRLLPLGIRIHHADFDSLVTHAPYHLIFANMALQWSNNFDQTMRIIKSALSTEGQCAFSLPLTHTFTELKPYFAVHRFMQHETILANLVKLGYRVYATREEKIIEKFTDTLTALRSLKYTGVNFCAQRNTKSLKKMRFPDHITTLTYHVGFYVLQHAQ